MKGIILGLIIGILFFILSRTACAMDIDFSILDSSSEKDKIIFIVHIDNCDYKSLMDKKDLEIPNKFETIMNEALSYHLITEGDCNAIHTK